MLNVKAREAADTILQVIGMTQLRIKPVYTKSADTSVHIDLKANFELESNLSKILPVTVIAN